MSPALAGDSLSTGPSEEASSFIIDLFHLLSPRGRENLIKWLGIWAEQNRNKGTLDKAFISFFEASLCSALELAQWGE